MSRIGHDTLNQRVYRQLRQLVTSGGIAPGAQLEEQTLASQMGVSRTPLREAITQLVTEGLVENRPYRGNFVRAFTAEQVRDLYVVRQALEGCAVRLAVPRLTEARVEVLRAILADVQRALEAGELTWYGTADGRFHNTLASYSENQTLIDCLERLGLQIQIVRTMANDDPAVVRRTALERPRILAALEGRDVEAAVRLMEQHIEGVGHAVAAQIEAREREEQLATNSGGREQREGVR